MRPLHHFLSLALAVMVAAVFTGCGGSSGGGGGGGDDSTPPGVVIVLDAIEFNTATSVPSSFAEITTEETVLYGRGDNAGLTYTYTYAARTVAEVPGLEVTQTMFGNVEVYVLARSTNGQVYSIYHDNGTTESIAGPGVAPALFLPLNADGDLTVGTTFQHGWIPGGPLRTWEVAAVDATSQGGVDGATGIRDVETDDYFWFVPELGIVEWAYLDAEFGDDIVSIAPGGPG